MLCNPRIKVFVGIFKDTLGIFIKILKNSMQKKKKMHGIGCYKLCQKKRGGGGTCPFPVMHNYVQRDVFSMLISQNENRV